jgi:hypothetical protein
LSSISEIMLQISVLSLSIHTPITTSIRTSTSSRGVKDDSTSSTRFGEALT